MLGNTTFGITFTTEKNAWSNMATTVFIYTYRKICQIKNWLILSEEKKNTIEVLSNKELIFLREPSKTCYIKVIKQTKLVAPLLRESDDEIIFTIAVYKQYFIILSFFVIS